MTAHRKLIAAFALSAVTAVALFAAMPAFAHARYKNSTPSTGEVLAASPARVEITFTQQIQKISGTYGIEVAHDRSASVTAGAATIDEADRSKLSAALQPNLQPGRYVVNWKNVSDGDGDPAEGAFSFYIGKEPNANDLENDKQLASVGAEAETPAAGSTTISGATPATASTRPAVTTVAGTQSPGISAATPIPTTTSTSSSGGSDNTNLYVAIGAAIVGLVIGFGAWQYLSRRRT